MKHILIGLCILFSLVASAQTSPNVKLTGPPTEKILVADETWVISSGKASFRIITSNDTISKRLMQKFENNGMTKFTYTQKKDRRGGYWERAFYFKNDKWNDVAAFVNTLK